MAARIPNAPYQYRQKKRKKGVKWACLHGAHGDYEAHSCDTEEEEKSFNNIEFCCPSFLLIKFQPRPIPGQMRA